MMEISNINHVLGKPGRPIIISGPCSAESEEQVLETCTAIAKTGKVDVLRAGIWKPRTRPGSFEGIGSVGLGWLQKAKAATGLKTAVEVANGNHVYEALKYNIDVLWIGARSTVNPFSVQEIADALKGSDVTVLVKNPINPDLELWMGAIERIHKAGITKIGAIHRGFSKFGESRFRNLPLWQLPIELKRRLPEITMINDPSHICGIRETIAEVAQEALDLKFDGLMIEAHRDPSVALSDAKQQFTPQQLEEVLDSLIVRKGSTEDESALYVLEMLRKEIDQFDEDIVNLLAKRMKISESIGEFKKENNVTILQPSRWDEIISNRTEKGTKLGLSEGFMSSFLKAVHQESINHQNKVMNTGKNVDAVK